MNRATRIQWQQAFQVGGDQNPLKIWGDYDISLIVG